MPKSRDRRNRKANDITAQPARTQRTGTNRRAQSSRSVESGTPSRANLRRSLPTIDMPSTRRPIDDNVISAVPGGRSTGPTTGRGNSVGRTNSIGRANSIPEFTSTRVGTARQEERAKRLRASSRRYLMRFIAIVGVLVVLLAGWAAIYNSPLFTIENVSVTGVEHLTSEEMAELASVPANTTLLRVDTDAIAKRIEQDSWVEDVKINRVFPDTLEIVVQERTVAAVVEISGGSKGEVDEWAIAEDHVWLMPIPKAGSEAAKTTSGKVYEDAENALHIVDVPYGTKAVVGEVCTDNNVNNALDIVAGMTTELADHVVEVSAAGTVETTLLLDNGVEVAFGKAEDIRDKERTILKILEENPDSVSYINVRMVENPTWRGI